MHLNKCCLCRYLPVDILIQLQEAEKMDTSAGLSSLGQLMLMKKGTWVVHQLVRKT